MPCPMQTFLLSPDTYVRLIAITAKAGLDFSGPGGTVIYKSCTFLWAYYPSGTFTIKCLSMPWYASCSTITGKISKFVADAENPPTDSMTAPRKQLYMRLVSPRPSISLSFDEVSQASHFAIAMALVALTTARFPTYSYAKYIAAIGVIIVAAIKEFWFDKNYEDVITRGSDLEDWLYYVVGVALTLLILWRI